MIKIPLGKKYEVDGKMRYVLHRIGDLELRRTENICTKEYYLEVVEWMKDDKKEDYCYTILIFEDTKEGYDIRSVGERILVDKQKWIDLGILIKFGFEFLSREDDENEE